MLWNDLRYALRLMRRSPGFTAVAVLSLALGIGANAAIFSLLYTVVLKKLPVARPEELVQFLQQYPGEPRRGGYWDWTHYEHFRDRNHVFSAITGTHFDNVAQVRTEKSEGETVVLEHVLGDYFAVLGIKPALGRLIGSGDVDAVVVSWNYWANRLERDPGVLGRSIWVGNDRKTIVGVAPRAYTGPRIGARTDVWALRENSDVGMIARLKPGVTLAQAQAEAEVLYRFVQERRAAKSKDPLVWQTRVEVDSAAGGFSQVRDQYGKPLVLLMAVVGLLLLLACVNVASLLLARAAGRQRELAVRVGLGAGRGALARQMLAESVLLSTLGSVAGIAVAYLATGALVRIMSSGRLHERIHLDVAVDAPVLLFTVAAALLTGVLFGIAPAWRAFCSDPATWLRQGGRAGESRRTRFFSKTLVATQVALSMVLVSGAAAFMTHLSRLRSLDVGFRADHVLLVQLDPVGYRRDQLAAPYQELLGRLASIPGVRSASISGCSPIQGCGASLLINAEGRVERPEERRFTSLSVVAPRYFETLGIPLLAGRDFEFRDANRARVAIISESMARHYFPNASPIGKHVSMVRDAGTPGWTRDGDLPYEVIGVVGDAKYTELREPAPRTMYLNMFQENRIFHQFELRTSVPPAAVAGAARKAVADVLKTARVSRVTTLSDQVDAAIVPERLVATLAGYFGALGAVLAGVGLYGLLAYTVARRTNEIGLRMALGATAADVGGVVLGDVARMVCAGIAAGIALVFWSRPLAARLLTDFRPELPPALGWAAGAMFVVALAASCVPAWRAIRVDPMSALRHE